VIEQELVEEDFVRILQRTQIDVSLQVIVLSLVGLISADDLLLQALDVRRKKSVQLKLVSLLLGKRCAFIQSWVVDEIHPARDVGQT